MKSKTKAAGKATSKPPVEKLYIAFGAEIRRLRAASGMTQEELAGKIKQSRASLANIERGCQRVLLGDLFYMAKALSTTPAKLFNKVKEAA